MKQEISVNLLPEQCSKPVALPVLQPPPGCLNRPRRLYPYESLPTDNSIRLLRVGLQQSRDSDNLEEPVRCSLQVVRLLDQPDYFALSYTWGDPRTIHTHKEDVLSAEHWGAPAFEIYCDGNPVSVSTNLYTALVSLRVHFASGSLAAQYGEKYKPQGQDHFYIWIDAICIDQDNLDEKGHQISLMSQIYGDCRCVLMWLGGNEPLIDQGWRTTRQTLDSVIDKLGKSEKGPVRRALGEKFDIFDETSYLDLGLEALTEDQLLGWYLLVSRSWFTRAWIMQEWALPSNAVLICGDILIHPRKFALHFDEITGWGWKSSIQSMICWRLHGPWYNKFDYPGSVWFEGVPAPPGEHNPNRLYASGGKHHDHQKAKPDGSILQVCILQAMVDHEPHNYTMLKSILNMRLVYEITIDAFRSLQCSDPRDKVYAFHGMFRNGDGSAVLSTPDYNKTVSEVYLEASKVIFGQIGIRILCQRENRDGFPSDLPTWALDLEKDHVALFDAKAKHYKASRGLGEHAEAELRGSNIVVSGYQIDTVHRASLFPSEGHSSLSGLLDVLCCLPEKTHIAADGDISLQDRSEVFWRTLMFDRSEAQYPIPDRFGAELRAILQGNLRENMANLLHAVTFELLLPLAKKTQYFVADSTCTGPDLGNVGDDRLCEMCKFKVELSLILKNEEVAVPDPRVATTELLDCFSIISKLNGDVPIDSAEGHEPPFWHEYLTLVDELRTATADHGNLQSVASKLEALRDLGRSIMSEPTSSADLRDRVLFATSQGRLGVSCGSVRAGDGIWLLAGLQYPVVLREAMDGKYFVVQCAYVHGIMHGESVPVGKSPALVKVA